jgi:hypothetical protein
MNLKFLLRIAGLPKLFQESFPLLGVSSDYLFALALTRNHALLSHAEFIVWLFLTQSTILAEPSRIRKDSVQVFFADLKLLTVKSLQQILKLLVRGAVHQAVQQIYYTSCCFSQGRAHGPYVLYPVFSGTVVKHETLQELFSFVLREGHRQFKGRRVSRNKAFLSGLQKAIKLLNCMFEDVGRLNQSHPDVALTVFAKAASGGQAQASCFD